MSGDASTISTAPPPTASDAVREMRAAGRAGHAVPADQVNRWATTLMCLFGQQRAVRFEQWGGSFWYQIAVKDRDHIWSADRTHCIVCNDPFDWADPYCNPPKPPAPIALKPQPFNPSWVLPLLDRLERALKRESKRERDEWGFRIAQLRKSIEEHTKEKSH